MIDNYDSFTYNIVQYCLELGADLKIIRNDELTLKEIEDLNPEKIIISPGPATPDDAGVCLEVIKYFAGKKPIFGICLGFQQLCVKFGGKLEQHYPFNYSSKGRHDKVDTLEFEQSMFDIVLKSSIPTKYEVNSLHHQGCFSLPNPFNVLAREKVDGNIEIARFAENVYGVQYHPEEIGDEYSKTIIKRRKIYRYEK